MMETKLKDSGIPWIGQIPEHWEVSTIKFFASFLNGDRTSRYPQPSELKDEGIPFLTSRELNEKEVTLTNESKYLSIEKYKSLGGVKLNINDIVFCLRGSIGKCALNTNIDAGTVASSLMVIRPKKINARFSLYYLLSDAAADQTKLYMNGTCAANLSAENVSNYDIPVPPIEEQERIAGWLDVKCGEIDELVEVEKQMISELEAYRQAVITEAVTHGLNPDAPTKPTSIPWLPNIPSHWETVKLKYMVNLKSGSNVTTEDLTDDGYPVYGGNGLRGYYSEYNLEGDYILIGRQGALCGNINYAHDKFWATEHAVVCHPIMKFEYKWLGEVLRTMNLNQYSIAAAQPGLSVEKIKNLSIPLPPLSEQQAIAEYLDGKCAEIDSLIKLKQEKIETLKQYRQSLIFEAVTGKNAIE